MKNILNFILLFQLVILFTSCDKKTAIEEDIIEEEISYPNRYYFDPENGRFYNTGHSPSQAWKNINIINERIWKPGDTILIKRGSTFDGKLTLKGSGTEQSPIVITSYGDEELELPTINGKGAVDETILFYNVQYWELHKIKVTNKGATPRPKSVGIRMVAENIEGGVMNHIIIRDCIVTDVYGSKTHHLGGGGSGIFYYNVLEGVARPSSFNKIWIENCQISSTQRDGITGWISTGDRTKRKANTNFVIRNNTFENIPGDQIIINGCDDAIVEGNHVFNCMEGDFSPDGPHYRAEAAAAIWCIHSDRTIFRYNIVQDHKATWDGQAFDCDQNSQNTLFEYNISYNNVGGTMLLCPSDVNFNQGFAESSGTIFRYNISINDGTRSYLKENGKALSSLIDVVGRVKSAHFYNNVFIKTKSATTNADNSAITFDSYTNIPGSLVFENNIFYNTTTTANQFYKLTVGNLNVANSLVFRNNSVYGYAINSNDPIFDANNVLSDPKFVKVVADFVASNNIVDKDEVLNGLKLAAGSPCIGAGVNVTHPSLYPLTKDFWGLNLGTTNNIGAYNH